MANGVYNRGKFLLATGLNLETANLYVLLVKDDYAFDGNNNHYSDLSANEISTSGYTTGGLVLTGKDVIEADANNFAFLYADNLTYTSLATGPTIGGAVLYVSTGSAATSQVISFYDLTNTPTNGGNISINWAANNDGGVIRLA